MLSTIVNLFSKSQKSEFKYTTFDIVPNKKNWDYEVASQFIFDPTSGEEYITVNHALSSGAKLEDLIINEQEIPEGVTKAIRYERTDTDKINKAVASKCDLGILTVLKGEHKGQEFLYQQVENGCDMGVSTIVYGYLAHNFIDKRALKLIQQSDDYMEQLLLFHGSEIYEDIKAMR
jgi:hypothetical protein